MHCSQCGAEISKSAKFCQSCGRAVGQDAIWNPIACANWSLIFTPVFGSYLHMLNWKTLGESEKAANASNWFLAGLILLAAYIPVLAMFRPNSTGTPIVTLVVPLSYLAYLIAWYFVSARNQSRYVKMKLGDGYPRRPWGKALLAGLALLVVYRVVLGVAIQVAGRQ